VCTGLPHERFEALTTDEGVVIQEEDVVNIGLKGRRNSPRAPFSESEIARLAARMSTAMGAAR
jgi:hypothetical protein